MKVVIVGGGGGIGSSVAFNLLLSDQDHDIVLLDRRPEMVTSHVMDLAELLPLGAGRSVRGGDDSDLLDADAVVLSASVPLVLNTSRAVFLDENARIVSEFADRLAPAGPAWRGVLIVVTNPVDPFCRWLQRRLGLDPRRVLGYTLNDSLRLRTGIGLALDVDPRQVDAWVIGEHGDLGAPLLSRVRVEGAPMRLTEEQSRRAEDHLRSWYVRHVALDSGRTSTWTSGFGVARMVDALAAETPELWPASVALRGEYGLEDVSVSVPVSLGRGGVQEIHVWELTTAERDQLMAGARWVRDAVATIDAGLQAPHACGGS